MNPKGHPATLNTFPRYVWETEGKTIVIRVPAAIADDVKSYAHKLDQELATKQQGAENADTDKPTDRPERPSLNLSAWRTLRGEEPSDDDDEGTQVDCYEFGDKAIEIHLFAGAQLNKCPITKIQIIS